MDRSKVYIPEKFKDHPIFNELICGTNFGFLAKRGYYDLPETKKQPELMKKSGINWTTLNMNFCQTNYYSTNVFLDFEFSTGALEFADMVKRLHDNGIKVLFKPCLTSLDGAWMGLVKFPDSEALKQIEGVDNDYWKKWFHSFTESSKYFADLAERTGVDSMIIGAEYFGTEGQNDYWNKVIEETRKLYSNPITYEITHLSRKTYDLQWVNNLDFISYSYYPPAAELTPEYKKREVPTKTVEEMKEFLKPRQKRIASICERFNNMPIAFTEFGVRSARGCAMAPANFLGETFYDGEEQANYMEAGFQTFWDLPQWMGIFWWKWDETQYRPHYHSDPAGDMGFTIQGKPAEDVMRKWVTKKR